MKRLDQWLTDQGLAPSRTKAQELIRSGAVEIKSQKITSPSFKVPVDLNLQDVKVAQAQVLKYVSRAGYKLEGALENLALDVKDFVVLDVGLSTGGFSDCLLQRGARKIIGVDVGHDQLDPRLQTFVENGQLINLEGVNARGLSQSPAFAPYKETPFDLVTVDVSFISLTAVLPEIAGYIRPRQGQLLALVKPQFEVGAGQLNKKGVVKDDRLYDTVKVKILQCCQELGLKVSDYFESSLAGRDGNREFFLYAQK